MGTISPCWELASSRPQQCHCVTQEANTSLFILLIWTGIRQKHPWQLQEGIGPHATKPVTCFEPTQLARPREEMWHRETKGDPAHASVVLWLQWFGREVNKIYPRTGLKWMSVTESKVEMESLRFHQGAPHHVLPSSRSPFLLVLEPLWVSGSSQSGDLSVPSPLAVWEEIEVGQSVMNSHCWDGFKTRGQISFQDVFADIPQGPTSWWDTSCSKLGTKKAIHCGACTDVISRRDLEVPSGKKKQKKIKWGVASNLVAIREDGCWILVSALDFFFPLTL